MVQTGKPFERPCTPPLHIHTDYTETFSVVSGSMGYMLNDTIAFLRAGEKADIPQGVPHTFWQASENEDLIVDITLHTNYEVAKFLVNIYR